MNGAGINHEGLYVTSLIDKAMAWRSRADSFADTMKVATIFSKYTLDRYGGRYYAKAQNIRRRLRAAYDDALAAHDLLLMPTVPMKATADSRQRRATAGNHSAKLGADPQHLSLQRHRPPCHQPAVRHGGRPSDRHDAGRAPLR